MIIHKIFKQVFEKTKKIAQEVVLRYGSYFFVFSVVIFLWWYTNVNEYIFKQDNTQDDNYDDIINPLQL